MKIGISTPPMGPGFGGPFESVRHGARSLTDLGVDVTVWMPREATALQYEYAWSPARTCMVGDIRCKSLGWSPEFARRLLAASTDILHTQGLWLHPSWVALSWKRRWNRPHVASVRGMLEPWAWRYKAWKKRWMWWLLERRNLQTASLLHATSQQELKAIRARGLTSPVAVIPNGVVIPSLDRDAIAQERDASPDRIALYLGRIHPIKGLDMLVDAWAKVRPPRWKLIIAGPDESGLQSSLRSLAEGLGVSDSISFPGAQYGEAKEGLFRKASLFILPSHSENFGLSVAEALAYEVPVITTEGTPWEEVVSRGCGWWIPPTREGVEEALQHATALTSIERDRMGKLGREWVCETLPWDKIAGSFLDCYRFVMQQGSVPSCVHQ